MTISTMTVPASTEDTMEASVDTVAREAKVGKDRRVVVFSFKNVRLCVHCHHLSVIRVPIARVRVNTEVVVVSAIRVRTVPNSEHRVLVVVVHKPNSDVTKIRTSSRVLEVKEEKEARVAIMVVALAVTTVVMISFTMTVPTTSTVVVIMAATVALVAREAKVARV